MSIIERVSHFVLTAPAKRIIILLFFSSPTIDSASISVLLTPPTVQSARVQMRERKRGIRTQLRFAIVDDSGIKNAAAQLLLLFIEEFETGTNSEAS
jgi:hypothetical protein